MSEQDHVHTRHPDLRAHVDSFLTLKRNAEAYIELSNEGYLHIVIVAVLVSVIVSVSVYATSKIVAMLEQC